MLILMMYNIGKSLIVDNSLRSATESAQVEAFESVEREGIVRGYLDKLLASNWEDMDLYDRRSFLKGDAELASAI
jgi:putative DNA primase/helicase